MSANQDQMSNSDDHLEQLCQHLCVKKNMSLLVIERHNELHVHGQAFDSSFDYTVLHVQELEPLTAIFDRIMVRTDGFNFLVYAIKDQRNSTSPFDYDLETLKEVARSCLHLTGSVSGQKMPFVIDIIEVTNSRKSQTEHLRNLKYVTMKEKIAIRSFQLNFELNQFWTTAPFGGLFVGKLFFKNVLNSILSQQKVVADDQQVVNYQNQNYLTYGFIALFAFIFAIELFLSQSYFSVTSDLLVQMGALSPELIFQKNEWYRLLTAPFLHANYAHVLINGFVFFFAGWILEVHLGRLWLISIFTMSALGGSLASLYFNPSEILSVGASGGIMGMAVSSLILTFKLPFGPYKSHLQLQSLYTFLPSFLGLFIQSDGDKIDYMAHAGGMAVGVMISLLLYIKGKLTESTPPFFVTAKALASASLVMLSFSFFLAIKSMGGASSNHQAESNELVKAADASVEAVEAANALLSQEISKIIQSSDSADTKIKKLEELKLQAPENVQIHYVVAVSFYEESKFQEASDELIEALSILGENNKIFQDSPIENNIRYLLAKVYMQMKMLTEAKYAIYHHCGEGLFSENMWITESEFKKICYE